MKKHRFWKVQTVFCVLCVLLASFATAHGQNATDAALFAYLDSLSPAEKIAQLFLINIEGNEVYSSPETVLDLHIPADFGNEKPLVPGGVLFFSYNIAKAPQTIIQYTQSIASYCEKNHILRPYLALDQEGGEVNRLRGITSALPSNKAVALALSPSEAYTLYKIQGEQLRALGFDINLAPVAEARNAQNEAFLGTRSYGAEPFAVSYSLAAIRGYQDARVGTVLKHFPGNTNTDPHTGLPEIALSLGELGHSVFEPFFVLLGAGAAGVLMSHARTASYDKNMPACLSEAWVAHILKTELSYGGLVLSDDIFMAALQENGFSTESAAVSAINAGVHIIMLSEKRFAPVAAFLLQKSAQDAAFEQKVREAVFAVLQFKLSCGILAIEEDGGTVHIREVAEEVQNGSLEERLLAFSRTKASGDLFYDTHFKAQK